MGRRDPPRDSPRHGDQILGLERTGHIEAAAEEIEEEEASGR